MKESLVICNDFKRKLTHKMDEGQQGSQYAIQIAVHTLRDRCKYLQQHVALLEEENVNLKIKCSRQEESRTSLNELDHLRAQASHSFLEN